MRCAASPADEQAAARVPGLSGMGGDLADCGIPTVRGAVRGVAVGQQRCPRTSIVS